MKNNITTFLQNIRNYATHSNDKNDLKFIEKIINQEGIHITTNDIQQFVDEIYNNKNNTGAYYTPVFIQDIIIDLVKDISPNLIFNPYAKIGVLASLIHKATHAKTTIACEVNEVLYSFGSKLSPELKWINENPVSFINKISEPIDIIISDLPMGEKNNQRFEIKDSNGTIISYSGDISNYLISSSSIHLSSDGIGVFTVSPNFFTNSSSIWHNFYKLGLSVDAVFSLPIVKLYPYTNITPYIIVVKKSIQSDIFIAQLSHDLNVNKQVIINFKSQRDSNSLDFGKFVNADNFRGIDHLKLTDFIKQTEIDYKMQAVPLAEFSKSIQMGKFIGNSLLIQDVPGTYITSDGTNNFESPVDETAYKPENNEQVREPFSFYHVDNSIYIPLIGSSDVVSSIDNMTLKPQNYAQVNVDTSRSNVIFLVNFLNSELGRTIRQGNRTGITIPKLNKTGINELSVFVPSLETQEKILDIDSRIQVERNNILSLQSELDDIQRKLWQPTKSIDEVESQLNEFSIRISGDTKKHIDITLESWFESLPFPLASILRTWQATETNNYKSKYEHLLHFFEAFAEFISIIYLSAFSILPDFNETYNQKLIEIMNHQNVSFNRATFGTWKIIIEYFAKQTREMLIKEDTRKICSSIFLDSTFILSETISNKDIATIISTCNKFRNTWTGHAGVVSDTEAKMRNETLLEELLQLRTIMSGLWENVQLISCINTRAQSNVINNEVALLVGSNSEFLKQIRPMSMMLFIDRLYLATNESDKALLLLPLLKVGPSPTSAKNACYFYSSLNKNNSRFISYHYLDQPEINESSSEVSETIHLLSQNNF